MIRRVLSVVNDGDFDKLTDLRMSHLAESPPEVFTPPEHLAAGIESGAFVCMIIEQLGYAFLHHGAWGVPPRKVIWLDELYISPKAPHRELLLKEFVLWLNRYCESVALPNVMFFAWHEGEALPFAEHAGARPVVMVMRMENPVWQDSAVTKEAIPAEESMAFQCAFCTFKTARRNALTMHLKHKHRERG